MTEPSTPPGAGTGSADDAELARLHRLQDAVAPEFFQYQRFAQEVVLTVGGWAAVTLEVFSRHSFGERYLTPFRLVLGGLVYGVYAALFGGINLFAFQAIQQGKGIPGDALALGGFFLLYVAAGLVHSFEIFYRNHYTDQPWLSTSFGIAWPFKRLLGRQFGPLPPVGDWFVYLYAEPWAWFLVGGLLVLASIQWPTYFVGQWMVLASLALFTKNQIVYQRERERELNLADAHIIVAARRLATKGAPIEETAGYRVVTLPRAVDADRNGLSDDEAILRRFLRKREGEEASV